MRSLLLLLNMVVGASCHLLRGHSALPRARQEIVLLLQLRDELALLMRAALRREVSRLARAEQYACLLLLGLHLGFVQLNVLFCLIEAFVAFESLCSFIEIGDLLFFSSLTLIPTTAFWFDARL